jgi:hypothetical protein
MLEKVDQPINVVASFTHKSKGVVSVKPHWFNWNGKRYKVDTLGLYHPEKRGTKRIHVFSFSAGGTAFRTELDSETLEWKLVEVFYD